MGGDNSILLYGALIWADAISKKGLREMTRVQRKTALKVAMAYSTVSAEAAQVLAGMSPIYILAWERKEKYEARQISAAEREDATGRIK